jgi:hypothetical protein
MTEAQGDGMASDKEQEVKTGCGKADVWRDDWRDTTILVSSPQSGPVVYLDMGRNGFTVWVDDRVTGVFLSLPEALVEFNARNHGRQARAGIHVSSFGR